MSEAWKILLALTFARMTMGFQFQSIPALASELTGPAGMSFAALGTLTGAYLLPGAVVALLGGWLALKVGASRIAFIGLALMSVGGIGVWWVTEFQAALFWRSVSGIGAVGLNVMQTKMAADWFDGREDLPTAMGVLVSSWPAGIAIATLLLPVFAQFFGLSAGLLVSAVLCLTGWILLALVWREADDVTVAPEGAKTRFTVLEWQRVILAGLIWAIYNVALIAVIAWTPGVLETVGYSSIGATAASSVIGWAAIVSVAAGGWLAAKAWHRDLPALACFVVSAMLFCALPYLGVWAGSFVVMLVVGLAIGPAAAAIMTLPVVAARAELRALAMGIYFAIYYAIMGVGPAIMGLLRDATGAVGAPHIASAILLVLCLPAWWAFRRLQSAET